MSHTLIVPSTAEAAIHVPSGVNLQLNTSDLCSQKVAEIVALSISQSLTLRSSEQDRRRRSSNETWHYLTQLVCPTKDCLNFPSRSHILIVLSDEQLIRKSYWWERLSFKTGPECAFIALCFPLLYYDMGTLNFSKFWFICLLRKKWLD